jgi:acyl-CoA thioester hydrolase/thioesterase-3
MNNHVHTSRYMDYVLYARFDQMNRCYGMPMEKFTENGWGWFVKSCQIEFKRPLAMGEHIIVRTWLDSFATSDALVRFQIFRKSSMKIAAEGSIVNTMISAASGRAIPIPEWVIAQYTQFREQEPQ